MQLFYDPLQTACKSRIGAIEQDSPLQFNLYEQNGGEDFFSADSCRLVLIRDGGEPAFFPMNKVGERWTVTLKIHCCGLYFYYFRVGERNFCRGKFRKGTFAEKPVCWQLTVYERGYHTPDWMKGGIMYQIFPDRFFRAEESETQETGKRGEASAKEPAARGRGRVLRKWGETPEFRPNEAGKIINNDFFGGNLKGITEKLDYLASLGVNVIYLNPIFESASNHRYDTGDYLKIDRLLGTVGDFDCLIEEAKKRGIRVILDGVFNHTGADSRYFNRYGTYDSTGAYQSKESPYADWFVFHPYPNDYDCWWGIDTLPAVNERSPSYQEFICGDEGVLKHWLRHGISGYRLDVVDELPDFFVKKIRNAVKEENPEAVLIGEVWEDASNKIAYDVRREYFQGSELDSVMNYPLKDAIIDFAITGNTDLLRATVAELVDNYPADSLNLLMNSLGTHDTARILTVLGQKSCGSKEEMAVTFLSDSERSAAKSLLKMAAVLQFTLPGVPCVYYGDEIGMEGYADPFCRRCYCWESPDAELQEFYRKLGKIRNELRDVFAGGSYRELFGDASCYVFERRSQSGTVIVYVNRSNCFYQAIPDGSYTDLFTESSFYKSFGIPPQSFGIMLKS